MKKIHSVARAYIIDKGHVLVASVGTHLFLPGGHVNYKEPAQEALLRELKEEIGIENAQIGSFVGLIENIWNNKNELIHENSIIFKVFAQGLNKNKQVQSKEAHLTFHWIDLKALENLNFLPRGLFQFLREYEINNEPSFWSLIK